MREPCRDARRIRNRTANIERIKPSASSGICDDSLDEHKALQEDKSQSVSAEFFCMILLSDV
jgi:hypothetical protein